LSRYFIDRNAKYLVLACASISFIILAAIAIFTIKEALPAFQHVGFIQLIFGKTWSPIDQGKFGILPMIVGSIAVTLGAMVLAIPLGLGCAVLLAEVAPHRVRQFLRPAVEILVGIPSVVYGLVGILLIVPLIRHIGGTGFSVAAGALVLMAMVLPTIISISEDSIRAVPRRYKEGAFALGATHWQTIWHVLIPAARSGITAAIILGMGRAIGEAMAMIMVIGNAPIIPHSLLNPTSTLASRITLEINYASGLQQNALFAIGVILFIMVLLINSIAVVIVRRGGRAQDVS
jgi:phosphate transport system permease protein